MMKLWKRGAVLAAALVALAAANAAAQCTLGSAPETDIYSLQQDLIPLNDPVMIDSVVVIGVDRRPSTFGVYVQEPAGGPHSGILCYLSGTTPSYVNSGDAVQVGDLINVVGQNSDFAGLAEIIFPTMEKLGEVTPLAPEVLNIDVLANSAPDGGEQWEGVLVRVDNVHVTFVEDVFRDWEFAHVGGVSPVLICYEKMIPNQVVPVVGDTLVSLTGVADFAFGDRRIAPRGNEDLVFQSGGPPAAPDLAWSISENQIRVQFLVELDQTDAETTTNYSLDTFENITSAVYDNAARTVTLTTSTDLVPSTTPHGLTVQNIDTATGVPMAGTQNTTFIGGISTIPFVQTPVSAMDDTSQVANNQVTVRGVVTAAGDCADFFPQEGGFYMQDRSASEFGAIFVFGPPVIPVRGDSVLVSGALVEFGVGPQTQISGVTEMVIYGNVPEVAPVDATVDDVTGFDGVAERYEAMLVRLSNVSVIPDTVGLEFPGDPFDITSGGGQDTLRVDDDAVDEGSLRLIGPNPNGRTGYLPAPYDIINVTGVMTFSGSQPFQRLQPRNWNEPADGGDIEVLQSTTDVPSLRHRTVLRHNRPNPFNPTTRIDFTIGSAGHASLQIFDLRGRLVATLFDEHRAAGPGHVVWDGRDLQGRRTPSGVYWYRLNTASGEIRSRQMVLLK